MLINNCGQPTMVEMKSERCKPDYEAMILRCREMLSKTEKYLNATMEFFNHDEVDGKIAELVGELYSRRVRLEKEVHVLIERQQNDG